MTHSPHSPEGSHSAHEEVPVTHHQQSPQGATISLTLSPAKLFGVGFLFGALAMAIPTAIFATKFFSGVGVNLGGLPTANGGGAPSANVPEPQPTPSAVRPVSDDDHLFGNKNAEVTVIEYSDMECPYCKRFHPTVARVVDEYKGKVNWVYRHFPLSSLHRYAQKEAEATECAAEQGGNDVFWKYLNTVFERTNSNDGFPPENLAPLAKELKLDEKKFKSCLESGKYAEKVQKDFSEGQAAGIQGTPGGFVIAKNGKSSVIEGAVPFEQLKSYVDQLLR